MTLSRRAMFRNATVGSAAIVGGVVLRPMHGAVAQEGTNTEVVLICTEKGVRVRSEPSLSGANRGSLKVGDYVTLTGVPVEADGYRWIPISVHDRNLTGWSITDHFVRQDGSELGWLPGTRVHVNTTRVNLHDGPGIDFAIVGNFNTPTEAIVNEGPASADAYSWYNITIDHVTGWMVQDFLTEGPAPATNATQVATTDSTVTDGEVLGSRGIVIAAADSPKEMKSGADYVCDGINDEVEFQAAFDRADRLQSVDSGVPNVLVLPGNYRWGGTVTKGGASLIGLASANRGVRILWDGPSLTTAALVTPTTGTVVKFSEIAHINFRGGTAAPDCWIDFSNESIDAQFSLHHVHFGGSNVAIRMSSWTNAHFERLRFDSFNVCAIEMNPHSSQNLSSFRLSGFTVDNGFNTPQAFVKINNTSNGHGSGGLGTLSFRDARIEQHSAFAKGVFYLIGSQARAIQVHVQDCTVDRGPQVASPLFYREDTSSSVVGSEMLVVENVRGVAQILGGDWRWDEALPAVSTGEWISYFASYGEHIIQNKQERHYTRSQFDLTERRYVGREAQPRFQRLGSGEAQWGDGKSAPDTNLYRRSANLLYTDDKLGVVGGIDVDSTFRHFGKAVGFFGAAAVAKPTVTGSRSDGTALRSLLSALASMGLIVDQSST